MRAEGTGSACSHARRRRDKRRVIVCLCHQVELAETTSEGATRAGPGGYADFLLLTGVDGTGIGASKSDEL